MAFTLAFALAATIGLTATNAAFAETEGKSVATTAVAEPEGESVATTAVAETTNEAKAWYRQGWGKYALAFFLPLALLGYSIICEKTENVVCVYVTGKTPENVDKESEKRMVAFLQFIMASAALFALIFLGGFFYSGIGGRIWGTIKLAAYCGVWFGGRIELIKEIKDVSKDRRVERVLTYGLTTAATLIWAKIGTWWVW